MKQYRLVANRNRLHVYKLWAVQLKSDFLFPDYFILINLEKYNYTIIHKKEVKFGEKSQKT